MTEITQKTNRIRNLYYIHYKAQILTKDNNQPQMMHNLELRPLYHTKNAKEVTHIITRIFNQDNKEIAYTTLSTPKTNEKICICLIYLKHK